MHRIKPLNELLSLLNELTAELTRHKQEILNDEILAVQRETRLKIKQLMAQLEELFPTMQQTSSDRAVNF